MTAVSLRHIVAIAAPASTVRDAAHRRQIIDQKITDLTAELEGPMELHGLLVVIGDFDSAQKLWNEDIVPIAADLAFALRESGRHDALVRNDWPVSIWTNYRES